ncbi:Hypothetical predicted protein [Lecanosticta acicola]|uniref:Heterokaryon incompatibility domain-containing protein n=1 Tax=Lecanosticta acicola TaxID=111012 RepID=A0AAI8YRQ6_9PEZI|nr:Hypothetical predicted protein [Lecanosticta acicola]
MEHRHRHHHHLYDPLSSNTIRLLYIRPSEGTPGTAWTGDLRAFRCKAATTPEYTAISYVWGDESAGEEEEAEGRKKKKKVEINGRQVPVLKSVLPILERLVSEDQQQQQEGRWIWIDSICINQSDLREKAKQVGMMGRIFRGARWVVVWLGKGGERSRGGMEMIRRIAGSDGGRMEEPPGPGACPGRKFEDVEAWRDLEEIARRPWFRRAWTLQESLVAQGEVWYYCGRERVSGREMRDAIEKGEELRKKYLLEGEIDEASWTPMEIRRRIMQWYITEEQGEEISLLALLAYDSQAEASDPRDRIYSLLGCVNTTDRALVGLPDYASPVETVYVNLVKDWIEEHQSLDILCFAQLFPPRDHSLPSWTPDWRNRLPLDTNPLPLLVSQSSNSHIGNLRPRRFTSPAPSDHFSPNYAASAASVPLYGFDADDRILFCTGVFVDTIDGIAALVDAAGEAIEPAIQSTSPTNSGAFAESEIMLHTLASQLAIPGDLSAMAEILRREVALSLVLGRGDIYLHHPVDAQRVLAHISALLSPHTPQDSPPLATREALAWFKANATFLIRGLTLSHAFRAIPLSPSYITRILSEAAASCPDDEGGYSESPFAAKFQLAASPRYMGMRLGVTEQGTVGMLPTRARKGDALCVLFGCGVPVVLRRTAEGGLFELIGEAYVSGLMEGEAVRNGNQVLTFGLV